MHDVDRDSLFGEDKESKKKRSHKKSTNESHSYEHDEELASKYPGYEHRHVHEDDEEHEHHNHDAEHSHNHDHDDDHEHGEHEEYYGHDHDRNHDEDEYHGHEYEDEHHHEHPRNAFTDRAFEHVHGHGHQLLHSHQHVHHEEEASVVHKWFRNPVRDWFALIVVGILIVLSRLDVAGENLGRGFLVMASVIGLFPLVKNSVVRGITERKITSELAVSLVLMLALIYGQLFYVAVAVFLILLGSFLRLDFSWNK